MNTYGQLTFNLMDMLYNLYKTLQTFALNNVVPLLTYEIAGLEGWTLGGVLFGGGFMVYLGVVIVQFFNPLS